MEGKADITEKLSKEDMPKSLEVKPEVGDGELMKDLLRLGYYAKVGPETNKANIVTGILENGETIQADTNGLSDKEVAVQLDIEQAKRIKHITYLFALFIVLIGIAIGIGILDETKLYSAIAESMLAAGIV